MTDKLIFKIPFLTAGLNGSDGLMQLHYMKAKKIKDNLCLILKSQKPSQMHPIDEPVRLTYIRYTSLYMDWDNCCASFKYIGDALQEAGVLQDDSPVIIDEFVPKQVKSKRKDARIEVIIEFLN